MLLDTVSLIFYDTPTVSHCQTGSFIVCDVQVLQVAAGELLVSNDLDLALALLGDGNGVAEVTGAALNLDAVVKELLESLDVEDLVVDGLGAVDDVLLHPVSLRFSFVSHHLLFSVCLSAERVVM